MSHFKLQRAICSCSVFAGFSFVFSSPLTGGINHISVCFFICGMFTCVCGTYILVFIYLCLHCHSKCLSRRWSYRAAADRRSLAASRWIATSKRWYVCTFSSCAPLQTARWGISNELNILITFFKLITIDEVGATACLTALIKDFFFSLST